jgi:hypothetical protein
MALQSTRIDVCLDCDNDLEHCHGTAIVHLEGVSECSDDPGCPLNAELHLFIHRCDEDGCCP